MRSTLSTFTKHNMGMVRRRTSAKQRSITWVVRRLRHRCRGNGKDDKQLRQVSAKPLHRAGIDALPAGAEPAESGFGSMVRLFAMLTKAKIVRTSRYLRYLDSRTALMSARFAVAIKVLGGQGEALLVLRASLVLSARGTQ